MKTNILRLAKRGPHGARTWYLPRRGCVILMHAGESGTFPSAPAITWPYGEGCRGVRLDWHWRVAKAEIHKLLRGS